MTAEVKTYEGGLNAAGLRFAIVCSRFNEFFVSKLLGGAVDCLLRHGASAKDIETAWVPGSYEIPLVAKKLVASGRYHGVIALGVVIQGSTAHANYVNAEVSKGLAQVSLESGVPVIRTTGTVLALFGVDGGALADAAPGGVAKALETLMGIPLWAVIGLVGVVLTLVFRPID